MSNHEAAIAALRDSRDEYVNRQKYAQDRVNEAYADVGRYSEQVALARDAVASITVAIQHLQAVSA